MPWYTGLKLIGYGTPVTNIFYIHWVSSLQNDLEYNFAKTAIERRTVRISCLRARRGRVLILTRNEMSQFRN
jgi:hypothetical protein